MKRALASAVMFAVLAFTPAQLRGEGSATQPARGIPPDAPPDVKKEIARLASSDDNEKADAAFNLGEMRAEAAIPFLVELLRQSPGTLTGFKPEVARKVLGAGVFGLAGGGAFYVPGGIGHVAAEALGKIGKPALPRLRSLLAEQKQDGSSYHAAAALCMTKDPAAAQAVLAAMRDLARTGRGEVVSASSRCEGPAVVPALVEVLQDKDPELRSAAASALRDKKDATAVDALIAALKDASPSVRRSAASVLRDSKDPRAVEPLIALVKDPDQQVRIQVVMALGELGDVRATEALRAATKDPDQYVRKNADQALRKLKR